MQHQQQHHSCLQPQAVTNELQRPFKEAFSAATAAAAANAQQQQQQQQQKQQQKPFGALQNECSDPSWSAKGPSREAELNGELPAAAAAAVAAAASAAVPSVSAAVKRHNPPNLWQAQETAALFISNACIGQPPSCRSSQGGPRGGPQGVSLGPPDASGVPLGNPLGAPLGTPLGAPRGAPLGAPLGAPGIGWSRASTGSTLLRGRETAQRAREANAAEGDRGYRCLSVAARGEKDEEKRQRCSLKGPLKGQEAPSWSPNSRDISFVSTAAFSARDSSDREETAAKEGLKKQLSSAATGTAADAELLEEGAAKEAETQAETETETERGEKEGKHKTEDSSEETLEFNSVGEADAEQMQQETQTETEERYIKVLVPRYIEWREQQQQQQQQLAELASVATDPELQQQQGEQQEDEEETCPDEDETEGDCLWAEDFVINTSAEGLLREVVVNTKQCRAERPLINTCVERLGWIRDDQTTNKG